MKKEKRERERPWTVCSQVTTDGSIQDLHGGWQILKPMVLSVRLYEQTTHMQCVFAGLLLHFRHYSGDITVNNIHKVFVSTNGYPSWGNKKWASETINEQNNRKQGQIPWRKQQKEDYIFGKGWIFRQGAPGGLLWAENRMGRRSQTEKGLEERDSGRGSSLSQGNAPGLFEENRNLAQGWWPKGEVPPAASWPLVITEKSWKIYVWWEGGGCWGNESGELVGQARGCVFLCLGLFSISWSVGSLSTHMTRRGGEARLHPSQVARMALSR